MADARIRDERGFTLVEFLVSSLISVMVLTTAATVAMQVQQSHRTQQDRSGVEEEARYAVDTVERALRHAGNNPYAIVTSNCPAAGTAFAPIILDPDGDGLDDDVRVLADVSPPNGLLGGDAGACIEAGEDVTIAHDPQTRTVTMRDNNVDLTPVALTDTVVVGLTFIYRDAARAVTADPAAVAFVQTSVTTQSRTPNPQTGAFDTFTATSEIRLRLR